MARRLALASGDRDPIAERLADAHARLETSKAEHAALVDQIRVFQESIAKVNADGVQVERRILGIEGEIAALTGLQDTNG